MKTKLHILALVMAAGFIMLVTLSPVLAADEQPVIINIKRMTLDAALTAAKAAIEACRKEGMQVAVTIVDRGGHAQVVLRDVLAPHITVPISRDKANTAMSFGASTGSLKGRFEGAYEVPKINGLLMSRGGLPIAAGGTTLGGIGVSGAPSGVTDEKCAQAGLDAIIDDLEMASD